MNKFYTEKQFNEYCHLLDKLSQSDEKIKVANEIEEWAKKNSLIKEAREQMGQRIYEESTGERPKLKRVK